MKLISIIIPIWNEERTLEETLQEFKNLQLPGLQKEIICINDGSTDNTLNILKRLLSQKEIKVITNRKNLGKSQSVKRGILASKGDIVVVQDADLEYDPKDLLPMSQMILSNKADVVYGNRYDKNTKNTISFTNSFGNKLLTTISNLFTIMRGLTVPDMEVCHKMMKGDIFRAIARELKSKSRFGLEPEITARVAKYRTNGKKLKVKIFPIKYFPRTRKEGKKMNYVIDGLKAVWEIIRYNVFE